MTNIIPTEEAERWAQTSDSCSLPSLAAAIRSLAAERDALREELVTLKSQLEERGKEIDRLFDEIMYLEAGENI
jgi:hypothetical protein